MHNDSNFGIRLPTFREQLEAFNEERRRLLNGKPINPEGEPVLMPLTDEGWK